jgi:hypothetical protein
MRIIGANVAGGASGSGGHQGGGASGSSGSQGGASTHLSPAYEPTHHLGGFPDLYTHSSREDNHWDNHLRDAGGQIGQGQVVPQDPFGEYMRDYLALGPEFHANMSLQDYCSIQYRNRP